MQQPTTAATLQIRQRRSQLVAPQVRNRPLVRTIAVVHENPALRCQMPPQQRYCRIAGAGGGVPRRSVHQQDIHRGAEEGLILRSVPASPGTVELPIGERCGNDGSYLAEIVSPQLLIRLTSVVGIVLER
jgi:hypothetical protein